MKQLIEYIVSNLVNHPEDVIIEEQPTEDGEFTLINIQVNPEDIGRVIGKSGKVIKAIRQITRIAAIQKGLKVRVDLVDQDAPTQTSTPQTETVDEVPSVDEIDTNVSQAETVNANETSKQVYPEPETLETEPEKEIK